LIMLSRLCCLFWVLIIIMDKTVTYGSIYNTLHSHVWLHKKLEHVAKCILTQNKFTINAVHVWMNYLVDLLCWQ
jgi:hypothetical protein